MSLRNLDGSVPELTIMSCNTSQRIPCFDSCQLTTTWMCNIRLHAPTLARKCNDSHWFSRGAEGRGWTYGKNFLDGKETNFLPMGPHARGAPLLSFYAVLGAAIPLQTSCKE